jgi:dienelactone hydrolase
MSEEAALDGFTRSVFEYDGDERVVYSAGTGPAVIVVHEVPGLHPGVIEFGRRVVARGFHVRMPSLFGTPGKPFGVGYTVRSLVGACVAREFTNWALNETSPIIGWLRALAAEAHAECGGPGVGAVGMCFTGGFALAMMVDERMQAPVLSQPSLPFPGGRRRQAALGISDADLGRVKERAAAGACVMGLRFTEDPAVPAARFETLRRELGEQFLAVEIDSSKGNPDGISRRAHSVLTLDLVDEPGHPTHDALEAVLAFFEGRLRPPPRP